jgi:Ca2+-binding RTX toxin-like protein
MSPNPIPARPPIDLLEQRLLFAGVRVNLVDHVLLIQSSAHHSARVNVDLVGTNLRVYVRGQFTKMDAPRFDGARVDRIKIVGGDRSDFITLRLGTFTGKTSNVFAVEARLGAGDDSLVVPAPTTDDRPILVRGGEGNDTITAGGGNDQIFGDTGDDLIDGAAGADSLFGGDGNDTLSGGADDDSLSGADGKDDLTGGEGNDTLSAGNGNDTLAGGNGSDVLFGSNGADVLIGGYKRSNRRHIIDTESDTLSGGPGQDTIFATNNDDVSAGAGSNLVVAV